MNFPGAHEGCNYLGPPGLICNKCGQHVPGEPPPQTVSERLRAAADIAHIIAPEQVAGDLARRLRDGADEIDRLQAALRDIEMLPAEQFIMQGPRLPASIARRALAESK